MSGDDFHPALGIDHGEARIGIAATDPLGILAHPVETIDVRKTGSDPLERIAALAAQRNIRTLVVGLPVRTWVRGQEVFRDGRTNDAVRGTEAQFDHARGGYWAGV